MSTTKTFLDSVWIRWPLWGVTAHSTSQGSQPTIASLITEYFEKKEPFIYEKPNLFALLWETCSPLTISTQDGEAQKARLIKYGTQLYEDFWGRFLVDILVFIFQWKLPFHELVQSGQVIYTTRQCDLDFLRVQRQVVNAWSHKNSLGIAEAVKHRFTEHLYHAVLITSPPIPTGFQQIFQKGIFTYSFFISPKWTPTGLPLDSNWT